jgi:pilus assembly protein CpaB
MRRGGLLILLIGLLLIVGAGAYFLLAPGALPGISGGAQPAVTAVPTEDPGVPIVVAKVDIPANTVISDTATLLEIETVIPSSEFQEDVNFSNVQEVADKLTTRPIRAGERITVDMLTEPGLAQQLPPAEPNRARDKAYPFIVNSLSGVADQINRGDFVDVVATFTMPRRTSYPTSQDLQQRGDQDVLVTVREHRDEVWNTTKTIVQRAQVIAIIKPPRAAEGTPEEGGAAAATPQASAPQVDASGQPIAPGTEGGTTQQSTLTQGLWTVILSVNDQEVELMEFALSTQARMVLVLRGAGDTTYEPTIGATFDLLISEFGVPLPRPLQPRVYNEFETLEGEPTRTPAPTRVP